MIPIVTPDQMGEIDRNAPEPVDVLIKRAGEAVARAAIDMLGGTYGRRVVVLAGKGNNGNDGRDAARRLRSRGVRVEVIEAAAAPEVLPVSDLVIDAAYGTGFTGSYRAPDSRGADVLAVDIPSGVNGLTGESAERVLPADRTITFAALKPGLLLAAGAELAGDVDVADIGLDVSSARAHLVTETDMRAWLPIRARAAHKWQSAVNVVGGSPGLEGAASLTARAALRAGAGYVRWSAPGGAPLVAKPLEAVAVDLPAKGWAPELLRDLPRFRSATVGNGLGLDEALRADVAELVHNAAIPLVVDADAITLLGAGARGVVTPSTVLTPHEGEFARLMGRAPESDRIAHVRAAASELGAVLLLKGPATIVASPGGDVLVATAGDARLATLGTGDVLAGVIAALSASGLDPFRAAAAGAFLHGWAAALGWRRGFVASDLLDLLPGALDELAPTRLEI
jgi:NAD(P)H-hydrate epimerase